MKMKFIPQHDQMDCGPACLSMIASHYGKTISLRFLRERSFISKEGVSLLGIEEAAKSIGFEGYGGQLQINDLDNGMLPCILHWNQNHFVVLRRYSKNILTGAKLFHIADPAHGFVTVNEEKFKHSWLSDDNQGVAFFLSPTDRFYDLDSEEEPKHSLLALKEYIKPYKRNFVWLCVLLLLGTVTSLVLPFLTQNLIDNGVGQRNMGLITTLLLAQLTFHLSNITFEIFRNWITLRIGSRISIKIIADFLDKLLRLPIKFFESKMIGDFNQRIHDHERIELFLTSQSLLTFFNMLTLSVFLGILWYYDVQILAVYLVLTIVSVVWSLYWLDKRKILDYFKFQLRTENQDAIYELVSGINEMKLNQYEDSKKEEWRVIQEKLFEINLRILKINQFQVSGYEVINQVKNIGVTFLAAYFVVDGKMTLGALLSVSYIIGQMNSPINQFITFVRSMQDAKLSLLRLQEIQDERVEEETGLKALCKGCENTFTGVDIHLSNVVFHYSGPKSPRVLDHVNLTIPAGKITAIVGASGSGKTTLLKLLLKFYDITDGDIYFGDQSISELSPNSIRSNTGVVMQDGYIFSDTIENNITTGDINIDQKKLNQAVQIANLEDFVGSMPLGYKTKIGASGNGLSGGQRQRILIARAIYKNPAYIFFDEATSALDAENEMIIHHRLADFFRGRTVLVIAHRLSTVKNADQIVVFNESRIVEIGTHSELAMKKGHYYNLVRNQLELGG